MGLCCNASGLIKLYIIVWQSFLRQGDFYFAIGQPCVAFLFFTFTEFEPPEKNQEDGRGKFLNSWICSIKAEGQLEQFKPPTSFPEMLCLYTCPTLPQCSTLLCFWGHDVYFLYNFSENICSHLFIFSQNLRADFSVWWTLGAMFLCTFVLSCSKPRADL